MPLSRLIYFSKRVPGESAKLDYEVDDILAGCRCLNKKHDITGILLADHEFFLQLLEGRRPNLNDAYGRILRDTRHTDVMLCDFRAVDERIFSGFQMLYQPIERVLSRIIHRLGDASQPSDIVDPETIIALLSVYKFGEYQTNEIASKHSLEAY